MGKWKLIAASSKGNGHKECQDSFAYDFFNEDIVITIVADGAGSYSHSKIGARIVTKVGMQIIKKYLNDNELLSITEEKWKKDVLFLMEELRSYFYKVSNRFKLNIKSLASTVIINICSPNKLLALNIGDGRAGYLSNKNEWYSSISPYHGEEVGQTVFITSDNLQNNVRAYLYEGEFKSIFSLSDGVEDVAFECLQEDVVSKKIYDKNLPFEGFFNPLINYIKESKKSQEELESEFEKFLMNGTPELELEKDDKTMVIGVYDEKI